MIEIIVCILAGLGAGLGTGFAGLSAAVFITPMLVSFLDVPVYEAVGIALASDVLASFVSSIVYKKNGNIDVKNSKWLFISVITFCILGSVVAFFVSFTEAGDSVLGYWSIISSLLLGISFIIKPQDRKKKEFKTNKIVLVTILVGMYIGFICGFQGAGGGLMLLFALSIILSYEFKKAVGTSVFIMTFSALIGAVSHFLINGMPNIKLLIICIISTTVFARIGSSIANKLDNVKLKRFTGILLSATGIIMLVYKIL